MQRQETAARVTRGVENDDRPGAGIGPGTGDPDVIDRGQRFQGIGDGARAHATRHRDLLAAVHQLRLILPGFERHGLACNGRLALAALAVDGRELDRRRGIEVGLARQRRVACGARVGVDEDDLPHAAGGGHGDLAHRRQGLERGLDVVRARRPGEFDIDATIAVPERQRAGRRRDFLRPMGRRRRRRNQVRRAGDRLHRRQRQSLVGCAGPGILRRKRHREVVVRAIDRTHHHDSERIEGRQPGKRRRDHGGIGGGDRAELHGHGRLTVPEHQAGARRDAEVLRRIRAGGRCRLRRARALADLVFELAVGAGGLRRVQDHDFPRIGRGLAGDDGDIADPGEGLERGLKGRATAVERDGHRHPATAVPEPGLDGVGRNQQQLTIVGRQGQVCRGCGAAGQDDACRGDRAAGDQIIRMESAARQRARRCRRRDRPRVGRGAGTADRHDQVGDRAQARLQRAGR